MFVTRATDVLQHRPNDYNLNCHRLCHSNFSWSTYTSSHHDAIFVDSMWNCNINGYFALTIVVQDENCNIRLTCMSISKLEKKQSWTAFFKWVKSLIPDFEPECIITDGASYIDKSFRSVVRRIWRILLSIIHSSSREEIEDLKRIARGLKRPPKYTLRKLSDLLDKADNSALINLKVFTGGTVTNSLSERINRRLRDAGLKTRTPMLNILRSMHNFAIQYKRRTSYPIPAGDMVRLIMDNESLRTVSNGALRKEKSLFFAAQRCCKVKNVTDDGADVVQKVVHKIDAEYAAVKKVRWKVTWKDDKPTYTSLLFFLDSCSCSLSTLFETWSITSSSMISRFIFRVAGLDDVFLTGDTCNTHVI